MMSWGRIGKKQERGSLRVSPERLKINSIRPSACGGSCIVASNLTSNYVFKPTPEQALRSAWLCGRRGLTRR